MKNKLSLYLIILVTFGATFSSCKKVAGEGGDSSVRGQVLTKNYNASFTSILGEYNGAEEDVYIIYGDQTGIGDRVRTSYDGKYEFKFLQPGKYKVFVYSKDSTGRYNNTVDLNAPKIAIIKEAEITTSKQNIDVENIIILD